ncbi:hypothetical protein [Erwinia sp.]|uniref:hypothetical protein n=1 Tax=Erwinia citreus TaxID=558 RepID=UPI003C78FF64
MTTIIWKACRQHGTSKSRYKARRAEAQARHQQDQRLASKIAKELTGCSQRVLKTVRED